MHTTMPTLLERLRQPDNREAWDRFVDLYTPLLHAWTTRMGLQPPDVADLVQDVFVTLLRTLPDFRYDPGRRFRGWLRTLVANRWRDMQRRRWSALRNGEQPLPEALAAPDPGEAAWEQEYRQHLVARSLEVMRAQFEPSTWQACWLVVVEGRPPAAVARELDMTRAAVYAAKARVLHRLRHELAGMLD
jgi:RNA polymerase sigma-70 factor (ECF subfamily)